MSKWKPGQLVTINRHVFRVVKTDSMHCCSKCDLYDVCGEQEFEAKFNCIQSVGVLCYFKRII